MSVVYLKPGRPIWVGPRLGLQDLQGALPRFWCRCCGAEVFMAEHSLCPRCEKEEKENEKVRQSLRGVYSGERSGQMRE